MCLRFVNAICRIHNLFGRDAAHAGNQMVVLYAADGFECADQMEMYRSLLFRELSPWRRHHDCGNGPVEDWGIYCHFFRNDRKLQQLR